MIECMKFKALEKGALIGYADFYVSSMGIEIFGCAVFSSNGKKWISMPSREFKDHEGNKKFIPLFRFREKEQQQSFSKQAWLAIQEYQKHEHKQVVESDDDIDLFF